MVRMHIMDNSKKEQTTPRKAKEQIHAGTFTRSAMHEPILAIHDRHA